MGDLTDLHHRRRRAQPDDVIALDSVRFDPANVRVYILAGQSNMCGCDDVRNVDPVGRTPCTGHGLLGQRRDARLHPAGAERPGVLLERRRVLLRP